MEQGTGKTWVTLADAERCHQENKIDALGVIAPNGVHANWVLREIPTHLEVPSTCYIWRGKPTTKREKAAWAALFANPSDRSKLRVLSINIDAMNTEAGREAMELFLATFRTMMTIDESTRIKNPTTKRTKHTIEIGRAAIARRILSGTPLTKGPTDLFSQFDFLKEGLLGTKSYRAFVAEYAVLVPPGSPKMQAILRKLGGKVRGIPQVIETDADGNKMWKNLDRLAEMIKPHSYRVRKKDCLDLPEKIYKRMFFELSPKQREVYDRLAEDYEYVDDCSTLSFQAIATRMKMKQATSGFVNIEGEARYIEDDCNPRMELFKEVIQEIDGQFIVWALFDEEVQHINRVLKEEGYKCAMYTGKTSKRIGDDGRTDRDRIVDEFQAGEIDAIIATSAASIGLTLTSAETAVYYSCSYDNEIRRQSEDRNHRIGTVNNVLYIDLIAGDSIDEDIMRSLQVKTQLADYVIDGECPGQVE